MRNTAHKKMRNTAFAGFLFIMTAFFFSCLVEKTGNARVHGRAHCPGSSGQCRLIQKRTFPPLLRGCRTSSGGGHPGEMECGMKGASGFTSKILVTSLYRVNSVSVPFYQPRAQQSAWHLPVNAEKQQTPCKRFKKSTGAGKTCIVAAQSIQALSLWYPSVFVANCLAGFPRYVS
jgi:hypothetical protein